MNHPQPRGGAGRENSGPRAGPLAPRLALVYGPRALVALAVVAGCSSATEPDSPPTSEADPEIHRIISTGDFFPGSNWNDPHVLHDGSQFIMFASAAQSFDQNVRIYRLVSDDGIQWELEPRDPVLERGEEGEWDAGSVETPAVVWFAGRYHLFYTGYPSDHLEVTSYRIGHAESPDGIRWTKTGSILAPSDPEGPPNLDFRQFVVGEPGPVVRGDTLHLYFTAVGANPGVGTILQVIGRMSAVDDGGRLRWNDPMSVLEPDQTLYPRQRYVGYSTPNAILRDGEIHLYVDVVEDDPWRQVALHRVISPDGMTAWVHDDAPLFRREDFSWTREEIRSPAVLDHDGRRYLYFAGHTGLDLSIGVAIFPVGEGAGQR